MTRPLRAKDSIYDDGLSRRPQDRNNSLLAHGVKPVSKAGFESLREVALAACAVAEADIPRWPHLDLNLPN